jgi:hypothetical protein
MNVSGDQSAVIALVSKTEYFASCFSRVDPMTIENKFDELIDEFAKYLAIILGTQT